MSPRNKKSKKQKCFTKLLTYIFFNIKKSKIAYIFIYNEVKDLLKINIITTIEYAI